MCGISGCISRYGELKPPQPGILKHRGPDNTGSWSGSMGEMRISLMHNRLSILDLSEAANQPIWSPDGRKAIIFNGEIYNYQELKKKYLADIQLLTHSDTEVLLHLLIIVGVKAVDEINGDFAFAFLNLDTGLFWLFRDRLGVKPLYYWQQGPTLAFGSEIKSILSMGVEAQLNRQELGAYFAFKFVPGQETLFSGIKRLPPAHYLEYNLLTQHQSLHAYWALPRQGQNLGTFKETAEELKSLIKDASRLRLLADVPVGIMLSGGLDSTIIAHAIKDHARVVHYCSSKIASDLKVEGSSSDFNYASRLASDWGLDLKEIPLDASLLTHEMLSGIVEYSDDLIADGSQIPAFLIARRAAATHKVLLNGMGADELFGGYHWHQLAWLDQQIHRMPRAFSRPLGRILAGLDQGRGAFLAYRRYLHKLGKYASYPPYRFGLYAMVGDFETAISLVPHEREALLSRIEKSFPDQGDPLDAIFRYDMNHFLVKNLHYTDRMGMASGLEIRVPFLDHRIVSLAATIPSHWKINGMGETKFILKQAYQKVLPAYIFKRRKAGFGMPLRSIFKRQEMVDKMLDFAFLKDLDIIDSQSLQRSIEKHLKGKEDHSALLFSVVMLQHWIKRWM